MFIQGCHTAHFGSAIMFAETYDVLLVINEVEEEIGRTLNDCNADYI